MARKLTKVSLQSLQRRKPDNPRQSMRPKADMSPDDARRFLDDLQSGMFNRAQNMSDDGFEQPKSFDVDWIPIDEKAKQYYGNDVWQLFAGINASVRQFDPKGKQTKKLKEEYGGRFVDGVAIGERLAVYEARDFSFSQGSKQDFDISGTEDEDDGPTFNITW